MKPLLTIAIPTFNRASYLDINLGQLMKNLNQLEKPEIVEIIVSDNASTDNTNEIVQKYIGAGIKLRYFKNDENTGFDGNFAQCLSLSKGKYFWIFGDDELLFNHSLSKLVAILENNDAGCIYVNGVGYDTHFDLEAYDVIADEKINFISKGDYIKKVNYFITFCTSNIINKSFLSADININKFRGTNLIQVHWFLDVLKNADRNIILKEAYFFNKMSNSGGYNLFRTFSTNFNRILKDNLEGKYVAYINKKLLAQFFPTFFFRYNAGFDSKNALLELFKNYYNYKVFWSNIIWPLLSKKLKRVLFNNLIFRRMKLIIKRLALKIYTSVLNFKDHKSYLELKSGFRKIGDNFNIKKDYKVVNPQYISIGNNFYAMERFRIEAINHYLDQHFSPKITIGNNVNFNTDIHIGCIDAVTIGDNCLFASRIYITDHSHGATTPEMLTIPPAKRKLVSKGPVVIKNNVWIGEGAAIMQNVTIGENSIVATNAVVTKDVPPNCVVAGVPAKVIKYIN